MVISTRQYICTRGSFGRLTALFKPCRCDRVNSFGHYISYDTVVFCTSIVLGEQGWHGLQGVCVCGGGGGGGGGRA